MASIKIPDISVSAAEIGAAMKKLSETIIKASETAKEIESKSKKLIFKLQVVSVFPRWYAFGGPEGVTTTKEETIQTNWTFTSDNYTKSEIKERILEFEEQHKAKYQTLVRITYEELVTSEIIPKTHYILEVNTA